MLNPKTNPMPNHSKSQHKFQPYVSAPVVDKLAGTVKLQDQKYCSSVYSRFIDESQDVDNPNVVRTKTGALGGIAIKVFFPAPGIVTTGKPFVLLELTHHSKPERRLRFDYNPGHLTEESLVVLDHEFNGLFGVTFYELLWHAKFTKIDWHRNVMGIDLDDYLFQVMWSKKSSCTWTPPNGKPETLTFGESSGNQLQIYNKAKHLHGEAVTHHVTRIEAKQRIYYGIGSLLLMANPFANTTIISLACENPPISAGYLLALQDACRLRGITNALKQQPADVRQKMKKYFKEKEVGWWQMTKEEWSIACLEGLIKAGLNNIPEYAPPLSYSHLLGNPDL